MNRRGFLSLIASAVAGLVLDPECLLWVQGAKTIFLPPIDRFSGNTLITPQWVTLDVAALWSRQLNGYTRA